MKHDLESDELFLLSHIRKYSHSGTLNSCSLTFSGKKVFHLLRADR